ncbi:MAG: RNA pyrophosphohydrolase [Desulforhopalus sp.]|nr:RNA pyrophosphohydrolase [Desulforhopalus sp.]
MKRPGQYYRAGAGAMIINGKGQILLFERSDIPGSWQLPQGGLNSEEEPYQAVLREVEEETGITASDLELIAQYPEPLAYELPPHARRKKTGRGQVIYFFLFRFTGDEEKLDLAQSKELADWRWATAKQMTELTADFRKSLYARLAEGFSGFLGNQK